MSRGGNYFWFGTAMPRHGKISHAQLVARSTIDDEMSLCKAFQGTPSCLSPKNHFEDLLSSIVHVYINN